MNVGSFSGARLLTQRPDHRRTAGEDGVPSRPAHRSTSPDGPSSSGSPVASFIFSSNLPEAFPRRAGTLPAAPPDARAAAEDDGSGGGSGAGKAEGRPARKASKPVKTNVAEPR